MSDMLFCPPSRLRSLSAAIRENRCRAWRRGGGQAAFLFLWMAFVVLVVLLQMRPPSPVSAGAPVDVFSSARAMRHVEAIGHAPHPIGTPEHDRVRDYILGELRALGLEPEMQEAAALNPGQGSAGRVENIVARLEGSGDGGSILVCGHYDSAPTDPGAGDNGVAVAVMLESLRSLREGREPGSGVVPGVDGRGLVFLFSDGEENGLLGSIAFVQEHPLAAGVEVVLDLDGIGGKGPAILAWTAEGDGWLVPRMAGAYPRMFMASWLNPVLREAGVTDLDSFARAGFAGAHIDNLNGSTAYHTLLDLPENVDEERLQAQGAALASLLDGLGREGPGGARLDDEVFFRTFDGMVVVYPASWVIPLSVLAALAFAGVFFLLQRRGRLTLKGMMHGVLAYLLLFVTMVATAALAWFLLSSLHPEARSFSGHDFYYSGYYIGAVLALASSTAFFLLPRLSARVGPPSLYAGTLAWFAAAALACMTIPPASFAPTWPLLFALPVLARLGLSGSLEKPPGSGWDTALLAASCLPALFIMVPAILVSSVFVTRLGAALPAALLALMMGPLLPHLSMMTGYRHPWAALACLALSLALLLAASVTGGGFDAAHPRPVSLFYLLDADEGRPCWATLDRHPEGWTEQFFPGGARKSSLKEILPVTRRDRDLLTCQAPDAGLEPPRLEVLESEQEGNTYTARVRITSPRGAWRVYLLPGTDAQIETVALEGKEAEELEVPYLSFTSLPPEGIVLTLEVIAPRLPELVVVDESLGMPSFENIDYEPPPEPVMPAPFPEEVSGWPAFVKITYSL